MITCKILCTIFLYYWIPVFSWSFIYCCCCCRPLRTTAATAAVQTNSLSNNNMCKYLQWFASRQILKKCCAGSTAAGRVELNSTHCLIIVLTVHLPSSFHLHPPSSFHLRLPSSSPSLTDDVPIETYVCVCVRERKKRDIVRYWILVVRESSRLYDRTVRSFKVLNLP